MRRGGEGEETVRGEPANEAIPNQLPSKPQVGYSK